MHRFETQIDFAGLLEPGLKHPRILTHEDLAKTDQFKVAQALLKGQLKDLIEDVRHIMLNEPDTQSHRLFHDAAWHIGGGKLNHQICGERVEEAFWIAALSMSDIEVTLEFDLAEDDADVSNVVMTVDGVSIQVDTLNKLDRESICDICAEYAYLCRQPASANGWSMKDLAILKPRAAS